MTNTNANGTGVNAPSPTSVSSTSGDRRVEPTIAYPVHGEMVVDPDPDLRSRDLASASDLSPGDLHYRAYVGPPDRYDFMGATQFALLFHLGLRDHHHVLDIGCGSLRLGRLLIPYLQPGRYCGIEPNQWLVEDGFARELGQDIRALKQPRFSDTTQFDCTVFGETFDFHIAQSIFTHTGEDLIRLYLDSASRALSPNGLILFTFVRTGEANYVRPPNGWHYPGLTAFPTSRIAALASKYGLVGRVLPWFHPRTYWFAAARTESALPRTEDFIHLRGAVLRDPQFTDSTRSR